MKTSLKNTLSDLMDMFQKRMTNFEEELQKSSSTPASTAILAAEYSAFKVFVGQALSSLQKQVELLSRDVDRLEMRNRRKILLFHGIPESPKENITLSITEVFQSRLKFTDCSAEDIKRCHRMGRPTAPHKPRPILVKLHDVALRDKIWYSKSLLKGSGITISEFLTKSRHEAFMVAREKFGIANCWTKEGFVYVLRPGGSRHRVINISDIHEIEAPASTPKPASY
ncbi:unnamed protein product, partial [Iphiclides podalirius]